MGIELKSGFIGIVTETADLQAPPGALTRAKNVVIRRAGACEVRPGLGQFTSDLSSVAETTVKIIGYEDTTILVGEEGAEWTRVVSAGEPILYTPADGSTAISPATFSDDLIPHAQTRGNLYIGTGLGVVKYDGDPSDEFEVAGVPLAFTVFAYANIFVGGFLPTANQVGYQIVAVKTDTSGLVTRSRPTGAMYAINTTGSDCNVVVEITCQFPSPLYDKFEIYRTRTFPNTVTPDQEMQLVGELVPTSTVNTFTDNLADDNRGATLYTSPSREGAEGSNDLPPACGALAVFKGALFCGNTIGPQRAIESFVYGGTKTGSSTGIGVREYTGTVTSGSANITVMSSTVGLQKGMLMTDTTGVDYFNGGHIIGISGATVTMSQVATGSTAPATPFLFVDAITLDGGTTWQSVPLISTRGAPITTLFTSYRVTPPVGGYTNTFVVESLMSGTYANLAIKATHGNEFLPALPLYDSAAYQGTQDTYPNGLRWSKPDEPEHFPPSNFSFVGDKKRPILALVSTRDAMFIFKADGIWRLTGTNGQYRTDPFDLTTRCVLPSSVVPLKNRIFALTNRGVVAVSDEGVEVVSGPIAGQLRGLVADLEANSASLGYSLDGIGYAGAALESSNEYLLLLGDAIQNEASMVQNGALVYNDVTRAWTSWEFDALGDEMGATPTTWAPVQRGSYLMVADYEQTNVLWFIWPLNTIDPSIGHILSNDGMFSLEVLTSVNNVLTFTPGYDAQAGDVILVGGIAGRITEVNSATQVRVDVGGSGGAIEPGDGYLVRPITCTVRPRAFIAPNQVMKQWTQYTSEFSEIYGVTTMTVGALSSVVADTTDMVETPCDLYISPQGSSPYRMGASIRAVLPVNAARGYRMHAETTWTQILGATTLEAIFVETREGKTNTPNLAVAP
jgi:hypothetical protein